MRTFSLQLALLALLLAAGCSKTPAPPPRELTASELRGQRLYNVSCGRCHRPDSTDPLNGPGLQGIYQKKFLPSGAPANDERVAEVIRQGRRNMPGYLDTFDDRQMADLLSYLKTL